MKTTISAIRRKSTRVPTPDRDHIQGSVDAPYALVEYGDYECPYCGQAYPVIKSVQKQLGAQLCFAFRNFPLINAHPHAQRAAEAAEAAGAQGRFWEMHDLLYENQAALEDADLAQYAEELHLDVKRLMSELDARTYLDRVQEDFRTGARVGVNGTPTLFANGLRFDGIVRVPDLVAVLTGEVTS